jgi:hypothetical protein
MKWAEPELRHAIEQLRWTYDNRKAAKESSSRAAERLVSTYSIEEIGLKARRRLELLREYPAALKVGSTRSSEYVARMLPSTPIPPEWYDEDYFEHGLKSNWECGYSWPLFKGVFEDTAAYLSDMFPGASSILDAGCAKGFLVRALRARGNEAGGFEKSSRAI